jgi:hypothetical protein
MGLPSTWRAQELGKRTSIERFFVRVLVLVRWQHSPDFGGLAVNTRIVVTSAAVSVIALAAYARRRSGCRTLPGQWTTRYNG